MPAFSASILHIMSIRCTIYFITSSYAESTDSFDFFRMGTFIDSTHMKLLWSNLLQLQCTCCNVPTTSGRPHGSPFVWECQWPSSQPLSSTQLSHNNSLWAEGISKSHREQGLDYREAEELFWCPSCSNGLWQGWSCGLVYCPGGFEECWPPPTESLPELP